MIFTYTSGWHKKENDGLRDFIWSSPSSSLNVESDTHSNSLEFVIGSPFKNELKIIYPDNKVFLINIKSGWHTYTIPFSSEIKFNCNPLNIKNENRDLAFMLSLSDNNKYNNNVDWITLSNLKSQWLDIVYYLHNDKNSSIDIITKSGTETYPIYTGGQRSISYRIKNEDFENNIFKFKLKKEPVNLDIKSIINRKNFYDFLGLSSVADKSSEENLNKTKEIISKEKLSIQWFVTWKCNMSCEYCWQESAGSVYRNLGGKTIKTPSDWAKSLNKLGANRIYFTGGEPTLYKDLPILLNLLNDDITFDMTSNFGKTFNIEDWKDVNPDKWNFMFFSLHPTQWENPNHFFDKLENFIKHFPPSKIGIEMVLHPENVKLVSPEKILEFSKKHKILDPHLDQYHNSNFKNINRKYNFEFSKNNFTPTYSDKYGFYEKTNVNEFRRQPIYCPAGWKKINIDFEGNVFTCMSAIDRSKIFGESSMPHYRPIGNIFDEDFKLNTRPILCWESFRCSACDFQVLQHSWTPFKNEFNYKLPIPE